MFSLELSLELPQSFPSTGILLVEPILVRWVFMPRVSCERMASATERLDIVWFGAYRRMSTLREDVRAVDFVAMFFAPSASDTLVSITDESDSLSESDAVFSLVYH